jgi:hypothetical protein
MVWMTAVLGQASIEHTVYIPATFFPNASAVTNLNISLYSVSDTPIQIVFLWDDSANADYYRIYKSETTTVSQNISNLIGQPITNSFVYTLVASDLGKTYYYQVFPYNVVSSQGAPSSIQNIYIPLALKEYQNVSWEIPSSWTGVSYEFKDGFTNVLYKIRQNFGYEYVSWNSTINHNQTYTGFCATSSGDCSAFILECGGDPCPGYPKDITVNVCTLVGGNRNITCKYLTFQYFVSFADVSSYSSNLDFTTGPTWNDYGCGSIPNATCNDGDRLGSANQAIYSGRILDTYNYQFVNATQYWSLATPGNVSLVTYDGYLAQQTIGNYRNLMGTLVWNSVGNQGTKTIAEYQALQLQTLFGQIRNLTGTAIYQ